MKIAQVCPRYYPYIGGVETYVREITERLVKKDFRVDVLSIAPRSSVLAGSVVSLKIYLIRSSAATGWTFYRIFLVRDAEEGDQNGGILKPSSKDLVKADVIIERDSPQNP